MQVMNNPKLFTWTLFVLDKSFELFMTCTDENLLEEQVSGTNHFRFVNTQTCMLLVKQHFLYFSSRKVNSIAPFNAVGVVPWMIRLRIQRTQTQLESNACHSQKMSLWT